MAKKQYNFRLSDDAVSSLRRLADILNISMAAALEIAIQQAIIRHIAELGIVSVSVSPSISRPIPPPIERFNK